MKIDEFRAKNNDISAVSVSKRTSELPKLKIMTSAQSQLAKRTSELPKLKIVTSAQSQLAKRTSEMSKRLIHLKKEFIFLL